MPRTRRAGTPGDAPDDPAVTGGDTQAPETLPAAESAEETVPKPRRRRSPRTAVQATDAPSAVDSPVPSTDAVTASDTNAPEAAPKRRGGRRRKTDEPAPETPAAVPVEPAFSGEASGARRRGRGRRTATPSDTNAEAPIFLDAVAEGVPTEEVPPTEEATDTPTPKKRPGGRRGRTASPPIADASTSLDVPVALPAEDSEAPGARRRRSRRRGEPAPTLETQAPVEDEAASLGDASPEEAATTDEEGARRSRRRRSRRRRGEIELPVDQSETGEGLLIDPEPVSVEEEPEDDDLEFPLIAPAAPIFVAPFLVPPALPPHEGALLPRIHAALRLPAEGGGLIQIGVNDQAYPPFFFFVNAEAAGDGGVVDAQIRHAADSGLHLYSGVMYLPLRNAYGDRSFGATDALVQQILNADPDAYILPRLQCVPTNYWARTHPDQMARYADGSEGDVSLASTEFWADCVDALESLIAHFADPSTPGGDRVIGFHLDRGEWFYDQEAGYDYSESNVTAFRHWLQAKYQFPYALRAAWFNGSVTFDDAPIPTGPSAAKVGDTPLYAGPRDGRWPDYAAFASDLVAQAITGLAEAIKTLSEGRLLVAVSYGYTLEFATRNDSGHLALAQLLESPYIDILAGPNSYTGRGAGSPGAFGAPIDSVALHGKLWLVEDDTKTFLAAEETPDAYNPKISSGADTQAAHERHFGAALAHRAGVTWMDLWGQGWLNDPVIWQELGRLRGQAGRLGAVTAEPRFTPDVAVLVDEASLAYFKNSPNGLGQALIVKSRDLLLRSGASVGFYLQSDVRRDNFPDAKLYLFLNAVRVTTEERQAIREKLQRPGKTLAWLFAPGLFDEQGRAEQEIGDTVGMALRVQAWNSRLGSILTEARSPLTDRLRSSKRSIGQDETLNPSFAVTDPQATVLAEYVQTGAASLAVREQPGGWRSVFIGDPHLTMELLRGLYVYANVPVFETQDDVIYASEGVLLVHAAYTGQRTITLPRRTTVYDTTEDRILVTDARSFRVFLRARTTRLFLWGEADAVVSATGLVLPTAAQRAETAGDDTENTDTEDTQTSQPTNRAVFSAVETALEAEAGAPPAFEAVAAALAAVEEASVPLLDPDDFRNGAEETDSESGTTTGEEEGQPSARRSRWQRRRAAMRAKRDADRAARAAGEGTSEAGSAVAEPIDMATLMPDLPPRRKGLDTMSPEDEQERLPGGIRDDARTE